MEIEDASYEKLLNQNIVEHEKAISEKDKYSQKILYVGREHHETITRTRVKIGPSCDVVNLTTYMKD